MQPLPVPTREQRIGSRVVRVFDGLLPDVAAYADALSGAAFRRTEIARPDTADYRHWAVEVDLNTLVRQAIYAPTQRALRHWRPDAQAYRAYRAYTNVASYGDMLFTHVDCPEGGHDLTALWYLCREWDIEWGGETVFFDEADEIALSVRPRPGRLVVFDGAIKHVGRPPSRICYAPRYTFAIKFEPNAAGAGT